VDRLDGAHDFEPHPGVVHVGGAQDRRERDTLGVDYTMALRTQLAAIPRIRAGSFAPDRQHREGARRGLRPAEPIGVSQALRQHLVQLLQTPVSYHSYKRRQQVVPEPHPSSGSSHNYGRLARRRKMMRRR
jgi:hypothetical protein